MSYVIEFLAATICAKKAARKMLVKLTPGQVQNLRRNPENPLKPENESKF